MKKIHLITILALVCMSSFAQETTTGQSSDAATRATDIGNEIVYIETANWGQNYPFNEQIYIKNSTTTHAKAGCVPVAYAIMMRHHGYPAEGTSYKLYKCQTGDELTDRVYNWDNMPLTYDGKWSAEQINEVSKLMLHTLHASNPSSIGTNATTVNEEQQSSRLKRFFNYELIYASYQKDHTQQEWEAKIRESLNNNCPVVYASNNSGTGDSRHMFIIDGYTDEGYFHFNFGWAGSGNSWFKLNNITPYQGDNYSWNGNSQHYAFFNLRPIMDGTTIEANKEDAAVNTIFDLAGRKVNEITSPGIYIINGKKVLIK